LAAFGRLFDAAFGCYLTEEKEYLAKENPSFGQRNRTFGGIWQPDKRLKPHVTIGLDSKM